MTSSIFVISFICLFVELEVLRQLETLRLGNKKTQSFRYAKNSADNVNSAIRQYLYFTNYFGLLHLPSSIYTMLLFMEFMARTSGYGQWPPKALVLLHQVFT